MSAAPPDVSLPPPPPPSSETAAASSPSPPARGRQSSRGRATPSSSSSPSGGGVGPKRRSRSRSLVRLPRAAGSKLRGVVRSLRRAASGRSSSGGGGSKADDSSSIATSDNNRYSSASLLKDVRVVSGEGGVFATAVVGELASSADYSTAGAGEGGSSALELCVLLLDPISRKFELLQFEFDSPRARVSDLLAQLRDTLTEKAVRDQRYVGVTDSTGTVREGAVRLLEAYGGRHAADGKRGDGRCSRMVLVAKPMGVSIRETMRLARPVLTDPEVVAMLTANGFDVEGWNSSTPTFSKMTRFLNGQYIPDTERVAVGGIASAAAAAPSSSGKTDNNNKMAAAAAAAVVPPAPQGGDKGDDGKVVRNSATATALLWSAVFAICYLTVHNFLTVPVGINQVLVPGTVKAKCGLTGYVIPYWVLKGIKDNAWEPAFGPSYTPRFLSCEPEYLTVSSDGSRVTITDADGEVRLAIRNGHVCGTTNNNNNRRTDDTDAEGGCVNGLVMTEQKTLLMGGRPVRTATVYYNSNDPKRYRTRFLSPWPFVEEPAKLKLLSFGRVTTKTTR